MSRVTHSSEILTNCVRNKGVIYAAGNGGSACDAMHLVEELIARYKATRPGVKAMHFADPGVVTCWSKRLRV